MGALLGDQLKIKGTLKITFPDTLWTHIGFPPTWASQIGSGLELWCSGENRGVGREAGLGIAGVNGCGSKIG